MEAVNQLLFISLENVIKSIQRINTLLVADQTHFKNNDITAINESMEGKYQILTEMEGHLTQLQSAIPLNATGTAQSLSQYAKSISSSHAENIQKLLSQLHHHLSIGYQHLIQNNNVVNANLSFMHDIWEKLTQVSQQNIGIYNKPEVK